MKKIICIVLAAAFLFLSACSGDNALDNNTKDIDQKQQTGVLNDDPDHYCEVYNTDGYVVKNGQSEYKLLVPENRGIDMNFAIDEFNYFFKEATGLSLPVVSDGVYDENGKYISLGDTALLKANNLQGEERLKSNGFKIKTVGDNLFFYGNSELAALYAMYEYFTKTFNYDYLIDTYIIDRNVTEVPLMNYNVTEIPDIELRASTYNVISVDKTACYRARMTQFYSLFVTVNGLAFHNSLTTLPPEIYKNDHPKWYASSGTQLSYCAQGDEEEYRLMVETVADIYKRELMAQPDRNYITLTIQDDLEFDNSEAQKEITGKYGAESASIILFLNDVNKIIREWFESEEGKPYARPLKILFFAYFRAENAPVSWNEEKQCYEGNAGIKCDDGVAVYWAPINIDYMHSIYDSENKSFYDLGNKWASITDEIVLWTYSLFYPDYLVPYNNFNAMQDLFTFAKSLGVKVLFNESEDAGDAIPSSYGMLKAYLEQRLMWNTKYNVRELTDKFFRNYYGEFAEDMRKIFNDVCAYTTYLKNYEKDYDGMFSVENQPLKERLWKKQVLFGWYDAYTSVINKVEEKYRYQKDKRDLLYKHIALERLSPMYMLVELYSYNMDDELVLGLKRQFKNDSDMIGGTRCTGNGYNYDVSYLYERWGI